MGPPPVENTGRRAAGQSDYQRPRRDTSTTVMRNRRVAGSDHDRGILGSPTMGQDTADSARESEPHATSRRRPPVSPPAALFLSPVIPPQSDGTDDTTPPSAGRSSRRPAVV